MACTTSAANAIENDSTGNSLNRSPALPATLNQIHDDAIAIIQSLRSENLTCIFWPVRTNTATWTNMRARTA